MRRSTFSAIALLLYCVTFGGLAGCSGGGIAPTLTGLRGGSARANLSVRPCRGCPVRRAASPVSQYIKHVVIVIQENRSFENIFAGFPNADAPMSGHMSNGTLVNLQPITFKQQNVAAMVHYFATGVMDYDSGKMDRFDQNATGNGQTAGAFAYSFLDRTDVAPYWTMAQRYVLADKMFPTMFGPSFTGHLMLVAGTADITPTLSEVDLPNGLPWGCDATAGTVSQLLNTSRSKRPGPFPCFTQFRTMADTLQGAGVTWHYYAPSVGDLGGKEWSSFDAIYNVRYGPYWKTRVTSPPQQILTDVASGNLAGVTWVVPDYAWSDHPNAELPYGPSWVSAIVNAIGQSKFWQTTAIVVVWDDWGGFFDDAPPPHLDFRGLGIRVPCLIISPYVTAHVSHTTYEFASILRFVEQTFNLPELGSASAGYTDARANSIVDSFNFTQSPRAFKVIPAPYSATFFAKRAPSLRAPDDE